MSATLNLFLLHSGERVSFHEHRIMYEGGSENINFFYVGIAAVMLNFHIYIARIVSHV